MPNFKKFLDVVKLVFQLNDKPVLAIFLVSMTGFAVIAFALYITLVALKGAA